MIRISLLDNTKFENILSNRYFFRNMLNELTL